MTTKLRRHPTILALILASAAIPCAGDLASDRGALAAQEASDEAGPRLSDAEVAALCEQLKEGQSDAARRLAAEGVSVATRVFPHLGEDSPHTRAVFEEVIRQEIRRSLREEGAVRYQGQFAHLRPLGEVGAGILLRLFGSEDETNDTRNRAATALGDLGGPNQVTDLEEIADDFLVEAWVEREAVFLLARFGNRVRVEKRLAALQKIADQPALEATIPAILSAHGDLAEVHYRVADFKKAIHHYNQKQALLEEMRERVRAELKEPIQAEIDLLQYNLACSLALDGRVGEAFGALDRSMASREITLDMVQTDGDLRAVRQDSRYATWLQGWKARIEAEKKESPEASN